MIAIIVAGISAFITTVGGIVTIVLNRRWAKEDKNSDVLKRIDEMQKSVQSNIEEINHKLESYVSLDDAREAKQCRARILRFNDELLMGMKHSKDIFDRP